MPYQKNPTWVDGPAGLTPITAAKLNNIEDGIFRAGGGAPASRPIAGRILTPYQRDGQVPQSVAMPSAALWFPHVVTRPVVLNALMTYCWTAEAGALLRVGLYAVDSDTLSPTSLILDAGTLSGATTGVKTATISQAVGLEFAVCIWASSHTSVRWSRSTVAGAGIFGDVNVANYSGWGFKYVDAVDYSAGLPGTAPTTFFGNGSLQQDAFAVFPRVGTLA